MNSSENIFTKPLAYFIGIGGIGTSSLARWYRANGWSVSGCDDQKSSVTDDLIRDGFMVHIGRRSTLPKNVQIAIYSQAIQEDHPQLIEARKKGIPTLTYPQMLGKISKAYTTVAVAGAHGKSTTTALVALMLLQGKLDPTVIIGTKLKEFKNTNFRNGASHNLVLEADEYRGAFLHYSPSIVIVLNIDKEHLDYYKNITAVKRAYVSFLKNLRPGGLIILNRDDTYVASLKNIFQTIAKRKKADIIWYSLKDNAADFIRNHIVLSGEHNVSNALAAYYAARDFGVSRVAIANGLKNYTGSWRRMEFRGTLNGMPVYDDYAHHPTEIRATLEGLHEQYPNKKILCVFQPHQQERLTKLFRQFQTAFNDADATLMLPTYTVAGRDKNDDRHSAKELVKSIQKLQPGKRFFYVAEPKYLKTAILTLTTPPSGYVVVMMGAGNIADMTGKLLQ